MDQKKDLNSNHEIIDEQEVIENLLDGNASKVIVKNKRVLKI